MLFCLHILGLTKRWARCGPHLHITDHAQIAGRVWGSHMSHVQTWSLRPTHLCGPGCMTAGQWATVPAGAPWVCTTLRESARSCAMAIHGRPFIHLPTPWSLKLSLVMTCDFIYCRLPTTTSRRRGSELQLASITWGMCSKPDLFHSVLEHLGRLMSFHISYWSYCRGVRESGPGGWSWYLMAIPHPIQTKHVLHRSSCILAAENLG